MIEDSGAGETSPVRAASGSSGAPWQRGQSGRVMLLTRACPSASARAGFDEWQRTRHIPEILSSGLLEGASYWLAAEADSAIKPAWVVPGLRMACYLAGSAAHMKAWFVSAGLSDSLVDGSSWFDDFHWLDGQPFTGNVYERVGGRDSARRGNAVLVDRWNRSEVAKGRDTPDDPLRQYCDVLAEFGTVICSTAWKNVPWRVSVPYYRSMGTYMVWTEFDSLEVLRSSLAAGEFKRASAALQQALAGTRYRSHEVFVRGFWLQPSS